MCASLSPASFLSDSANISTLVGVLSNASFFLAPASRLLCSHPGTATEVTVVCNPPYKFMYALPMSSQYNPLIAMPFP